MTDQGDVPRGAVMDQRAAKPGQLILERVVDIRRPGRTAEAEKIHFDQPLLLRQRIELVAPVTSRALQSGDQHDGISVPALLDMEEIAVRGAQRAVAADIDSGHDFDNAEEHDRAADDHADAARHS
jgi:hypothetical protein